MDRGEADCNLVRRARAGESSAFAELASSHRTGMWSVCLRITGNPHDAEDALQDALTAAWQHLGSFRGEARLGTWLHRIAANASLAVLRRRRDLLVQEVAERDPGRDVAERVAARDSVQRAVAQLPPEFREALVLREIADLSYVEIAEHQRVPVQTVKSRLHRARAAVAPLLSS